MADMYEYENAARYIIEVAKAHEIRSLELHSCNYSTRQEFLQKFSPDKLKALPEEYLLETLFLGGGSLDSMSNWLLNKTRIGFGNLGGYPSQFGLYGKRGLGWTADGFNELSEYEALAVGKKVLAGLLACCDAVQARIDSQRLESMEDYAKLQREMDTLAGKDFGEQAWVRKYLYMVYPEYFVSWYKEEFIAAFLSQIGIYPAGSVYGKVWQMLLLEKTIASQAGSDRTKANGKMASLCWNLWRHKIL